MATRRIHRGFSRFSGFIPSLSMALVFLIGFGCCSHALAADPDVELIRPSRDPSLKIEAFKRFGKTRIPYGGAFVTVSSAGGQSWLLHTDLLGRASLPASDILEAFPAGTGELTLTVTLFLDKQTNSKSLQVSKPELERYAGSAGDALVEEGNTFAKSGNLTGALDCYKKAALLDPNNARALYNTALAYEKAGMSYLSLDAYTRYLQKFTSSSGDREAVKRKAVAIAKTLNPLPPIPRTLFDRMEESRKLVSSGEFYKGLWGYELVQSAAPWWPEPYYAAGLVYEHLALQDSTSYLEHACRNFELFLLTAPASDPRAVNVRRKLEQLKSLQEGLNTSQTIPAH